METQQVADNLLNHANKIIHSTHPYYPLEAKVIGYLANEYSVLHLISVASFVCTIVLALTYAAARWRNPLLQTYDIAVVMWFVLSGCLHLFFEGYFVLNHKDLVSHQSFFGQLWKEYGLSDSRYLTEDPFVLCVEITTVSTLGPLCFVTAFLSILSHPMQHPLRIIVSVGHIYSDILYFVTSIYAHHRHGISYSRPEAIYFWGYYVFLNLLWIVIPAYLIRDSVKHIAKAVRMFDEMERNSKAKRA